ncbi:MAG: LamG domain-containing protein [Myxococcota bacterium]
MATRAAVAVLGALCGCQGGSAFACQEDIQCEANGQMGRCEGIGFCSFPDDDCPSGFSYGRLAGGLAGKCTPVADATSGGPNPPATTSDGAGPTVAGLSATGESTTGAPGDSGAPDTTASNSGTGSSAETTASSTSGTSTGREPLDPDLVLWMPMDGAGGGAPVDASSFSHDSSCTDCPVSVAGISGNARQFNGDNNHVTVPHTEAFEADGITLAAWVSYPVVDISLNAVVAKPLGPNARNSWELLVRQTQSCIACVVFGTGNVGTAVFLTAPAPPVDTWVHLAATWDGDQTRLYFDGALVASGNNPLVEYDTSPVLVGGDSNQGVLDGGFGGTIDDLRIYRRALDENEISDLASQ